MFLRERENSKGQNSEKHHANDDLKFLATGVGIVVLAAAIAIYSLS
jgi:hypothetical protein